MRRRILLIPLALVGGIARADDAPKPPEVPGAAAPTAKPAPPPTSEQAADAVLSAAKAKDDAALKALAARDEPDPWLVADELVRRGEFDAADAFAKAAPRVDVERLPAYVSSRHGKPDDAARRERLANANAALGAGKPTEALAALGANEPAPFDDVVGVRLAMGRGFALARLVRLAASAAAFLEAGEAAERIGWIARASRAFNESAGSAYDGSRFVAARLAWERELSICERRGDKLAVATTLGDIGRAQNALADYTEALATHERSFAASEAIGDAAGAARTLGNIGTVHFNLGDLSNALAAFERARAAFEAQGRKRAAANVRSGIGGVHYALGDYAKALSTLELALAAQEALGDAAGAAKTMGNIGNVHYSLGDHARALAMDERALAVKEAAGDAAGVAGMLGNIGLLYVALGDYPKALAAGERARAAQEALRNRAGVAFALGCIGAAYDALGDAPNALATYERLLSAREALKDKLGVAWAVVGIGSAHASLGHSAMAIEFLDRAVRTADELGASGLLVNALRRRAHVRLRSGDAAAAISDARRATSLLPTLVGGLGEEQGATARGRQTDVFSRGLAAAAMVADASQAAFFLESGRAGTLLEALKSRAALRASLLPEHLRVAEAQARGREARALAAYQGALDGVDLVTIRARTRELDAARAAIVDVVERIQREAKRAAQVVYPVASSLGEIQGFLVPGDTLVLYGLAEQDDYAYALVLTEGAARIVGLGKSSAIVAACEALDATDPGSDPTTALAALRDLLIKPLGLAKETKRLLVSPDGPLSYVPFAALAPDLVVAYESSGSTYGVLREERDKRGEQVLALADADYTAKFDPIALDVYAPLAAVRTSATRGGRLAPLPGTREEATAIADVKLFGNDASEPGLRSALAKRKDRWHSVHFACHGLVNPDRPTLSSLALTPQGEDDGFLTALEVLKMEIPSDLVVLSACETGKGKIVGGEGIVGLTRAFMYAGSPRVICSLWKVDDDATRALMTKFYELWNPTDGKPGLPTAEALKQAQEFVKSQEKWKHPYYWAAWVLWGLPG